MKIILLLCLSTFAGAADLPAAPSHTGWLKPTPFKMEIAAYTIASTLDGITTAQNGRLGFYELGFPQGSAWMLGKYPSSARYAVTFGAIEIAEAVLCYRLQHSRRRALRILGHGILLEQTYEHFSGVRANLGVR